MNTVRQERKNLVVITRLLENPTTDESAVYDW
jgi:hypothetical protein